MLTRFGSFSGLRSAGAAVFLVIVAVASAQRPVTYSLTNGQGTANSGTWQYWDDTYSGTGDHTVDGAFLQDGLGQLTDGVVGTTDWTADLGHGNAYEWVAWRNITPTITFDYGSIQRIDTMEFHSNNNQGGGVYLWDSIEFAFSNDGQNYVAGPTRLSTASERADTSARFIKADLGVATRYVQMKIFRQPNQWAFISEITTNNNPVPEPASVAALGLGALALLRRRRVS